MIAPRWRKVLRDLWVNRARTLLIVLTIAAGVFAIGAIGAAQWTLQRQLPAQYREINPADIIFTTSEFDADLANSVESISGVSQAEARRNLYVRMQEDAAAGTWRDLFLFGIVDYADMRIDKIWPVSGAWPPPKGTLLMERGSMSYLNLKEGQQITIKTPQGKQRTLTISGAAHDLYHMPAFIEGTVYGFISDDTLRWLGQDVAYNELYVKLEGNVRDAAYMQRMKEKITDHMEGTGLVVYVAETPNPDGYPMDYIANTVLLLLVLLGGVILLLGAFLVINTISALVVQQARQIAVIKAVGGRTRQVLGIYLVMVFILGVLSALIAIPFSVLAARALVEFIGSILNFNARLETFPQEIILLQLAVGILVPLAAALIPIWGSARRPPALALSEYGRERVWSGVRAVDHALRALPGLTRLERLAARNPFLNRRRLVFSLMMLSLAGGSFISVINLQTSLQQTVDDMLSFWQYDFWVQLNRPYLSERLEREAMRIPGVSGVEGWGFEVTRRVRLDGSESNPIYFYGIPAESDMVKPIILQGRWLVKEDRNALVIGMGLLNAEPDLGIGKEMVLKVDGEEETFHIVGVMEMIGNQTVGYLCYTTIETYNRMSSQANRADLGVVLTSGTTPQERESIGAAVENGLEDSGLEVVSIMHMDDERMEVNSAFGILISLLLIMVLLLALVGGLGLMGTMSLNVIERSREIGVIRAFGGSNRSVFRVVVLEGIVIGMISWVLSLLLALPLTRLFCDLVGHSFLSMALTFRYSIAGALLWLGLVTALAAISSALPAANAVRLTVREVLSYE